MLWKILFRYKNALEEFEINNLKKTKYFQSKFREAELHIRSQNEKLKSWFGNNAIRESLEKEVGWVMFLFD
jgi:hypothetical protein